MQLDELNRWIEDEKPRIEHTLRTLVEINTYTANQAGVDQGMDLLSELAQELKLTVEAINGRHRLLKAGDGASKPRILLISHMDTVFPPDGDFLKYEPQADGFVRGPGVGDIKGGLVIGLWSMLAIRDLVDEFDVQMIVSADEETGSPSIRDWYMDGHIGADYAIGLEPGFPQGELSPTVPLGVVYQRRGYGAISFTVHGRAAHSGSAHLGLNALEAMAQRITRVHALSEPNRGISTTIGMVNGGISPNTVPGEAKGTASFRYERMVDGEKIKASIERILKDRYVHNAEFDQWDHATYQVDAFIPPMERSEKSQILVDTVLAEAKRLSQNVTPIARGGGSDANFVNAAGTPAICGMGAPAEGIHTTSERIYLPGLFDRVNLLASTLYRLVATS
jgi:glutamate carboxypeptidase